MRESRRRAGKASSLKKSTQIGPGAAAAGEPRFSRNDWLVVAALVVAVFLVYQPCWQGGFIWDDDEHVTRPELRSLHGLVRIWTDYSSTSQYYPLLHSLFWLEYKLWAGSTLGYHLANIALHAAVVVMVLAVLRRLRIGGAYLAAAIFALHPVQVESVAWITEQKNTLSALFYLAAAIHELQEALKINPASAEAHFNLGNVFANCGRFDEAASEYRKALDLVPDYEDAQRNLAAVRGRINNQ